MAYVKIIYHRFILTNALVNGVLLLCFLLIANGLNAQSLVINEVMSKNETAIADRDGEFSDWIEIYNTTSDIIQLKDYGLSDDEDDLFKWTFPDLIIPPNGLALIFASGKDYTFGELHTNFSIKSGGEELFLTNANGQMQDMADAVQLASDQSYGRSDDGADDWVYFSTSSPGTTNANGVVIDTQPTVVLNEVQSYNTIGIQDKDGEYNDWIELYNASSESINLGGYSLTDDEDEPQKWIFPNVTINAGEFLLVFASGKDLTGSELHCNFSVKSSGEDIFLYDASGTLVDFIPDQQLIIDQSYGRDVDGTGDWEEFSYNSPGESNANGNLKHRLDFSQDPGQYASAFDLEIYFEEDQDNEGLSIYYTTDGSEPTMESNLYQQTIDINSREGEPNYYSTSQFQTTEELYEPRDEVYKINVVRARIFKNGKPASKVYTKSYMIHPDFDRYTIPMISIVSDPENLFDDEKGIYVVGSNYDGDRERTMNCFQRGREWERFTHFEFFMDDETIAQDGGLRIHGGGSRRQKQKSLRLYARSEYDNDNTFEYPFFTEKPIEEFKRLVLRAQPGSNHSYMTDEIVSNLCKDMDIDRMATRPAIVFINGEYWGIYSIRERIDKYYLENNHGVDEDDVTLLEDLPYNAGCCAEGTAEEYIELLNYLANNNLNNPDVYAYVEQQIDLEEYANYLITEFWAANYDWPQNNIRYWKANEEGAKWRWILFDLDFGLRFYERPSVLNYLGNLDSNTTPEATELGNSLFKSDAFTDMFISKFEYHLNNTFSPEKVACEAITYRDWMMPDMEESLDRFDEFPSYSRWLEFVAEMYEEYAAFRPCEIQDQIEEQFGVLINVGECQEFMPDGTPCIFENQNDECEGLTATITGLPVSAAIQSSIDLTAQPSGGTFSGAGVVFNTFNTSVLPPGTHTINYTYTYDNGCTAVTSKNILLYTIELNIVNYTLGTVAPKYTDNIDLEIEVMEDDVYNFQVFDVNGKLLGNKQQYLQKGIYKENFQLSQNLSKGMFFVNVNTSKFSYSKKFIH